MERRTPYKTGKFALTPRQVEILLQSFNDLQEKAIISLAIAAGLRREDIVNIKRKDFNPDDRQITFYEHKKNKTRTIVIPSPQVVQTLIMHINSCRKSEWLFPSPLKGKLYKDKHISSRQIYDVLNEHLDKVGIPRRPFHSLRATCYKLCQSHGWPPRKAAELIGDSQRVAEEHYGAPSDEEMREIAKDKPIL